MLEPASAGASEKEPACSCVRTGRRTRMSRSRRTTRRSNSSMTRMRRKTWRTRLKDENEDKQ